MSLAPIRADFCTTVIYEKIPGSGTVGNTFPSTITVQIESSPLIHGVIKRRLFFPSITKTAEAATTQAGYRAIATSPENLTAKFRSSTVPLLREGFIWGASCGTCSINEDSSAVVFDVTTANTTDIMGGVLEFETQSKLK